MRALFLPVLLFLGGFAPVLAGPGEPSAASSLQVLDQVFCLGVDKRMPVQDVNAMASLDSGVGRLWCWTRVRNAGVDSAIEHVWYYEGEERARIRLKVGTSPGWRTWSNKRIAAHERGQWLVRVEDANGQSLGEFPLWLE